MSETGSGSAKKSGSIRIQNTGCQCLCYSVLRQCQSEASDHTPLQDLKGAETGVDGGGRRGWRGRGWGGDEGGRGGWEREGGRCPVIIGNAGMSVSSHDTVRKIV